MSRNLIRVAENFLSQAMLLKVAGRKKHERRPMTKELEKLRSKYLTLQKEEKVIAKEHAKTSAKLDELHQEMAQGRKRIKELGGTLQAMDLIGADHAMVYDDGDVGYVIDGKEMYLSWDGDNPVTTPMRDYRRSKKRELLPEEKEEMAAEGIDLSELESTEDADQNLVEDSELVGEEKFDDQKLLEFLEKF